MELILQLIFWFIYLYISAGTLYLLVIAIAGLTSGRGSFGISPVKIRIVVIIPAYREDAIILDTVQAALSHDYPVSSFKVVVIADGLQPQTMQALKKMPVMLLEVDFELSTKAGSLIAALGALNDELFDTAVILDADNIMENGCLEKINHAFQQGSRAVQCHRIAKNLNTPVALLDAISEEININLFRRGPSALGLSAAPMGSGMAFDFLLLKEIFQERRMVANLAEDREIEVQLMLRGIKMTFIDNALVLDEKVANASGFEKQRTRWLEAQMNHVVRLFKPDITAFPKTPVYFNQLVRNLLLPRLLFFALFGVIFMLFVLQQLVHTTLVYPSPQAWTVTIAVYFTVLLISVPARFYRLNMLRAIAYLPVLMIRMLKALLNMKRNRRQFLHTSKTFTMK